MNLVNHPHGVEKDPIGRKKKKKEEEEEIFCDRPL
jgi:hypothetical protein